MKNSKMEGMKEGEMREEREKKRKQSRRKGRSRIRLRRRVSAVRCMMSDFLLFLAFRLCFILVIFFLLLSITQLK